VLLGPSVYSGRFEPKACQGMLRAEVHGKVNQATHRDRYQDADINALRLQMSRLIILADMQASVGTSKQLLRAIAPSGNLFLVLTLQELRRQGLTFIAFYALQRTIEESEFSVFALRRETGLPDYEVSRACRFLVSSELVKMSRFEEDARVRLLSPTRRGVKIHDQILSAAARRLQEGLDSPGEERRLAEAIESFRQGNRTLLGPLQLSFFDIEDYEKARTTRPKRRRSVTQRQTVVPRDQKPK
jgi:DNA-binding MarR family transcriptional regulator